MAGKPTCAPRWMSLILVIAAVYNLAWGVLAIVTPTTMLGWFGFDPLPAYPEFWQCIGMIVGVYGVGYAIAALDPYRHWPIVLVGLLGKILGPLGFAKGIILGNLPAALGWTILTNDLIWWTPFAAILWGALKAAQSRNEMLHGMPASDSIEPTSRILSQYGMSLQELSRQQPVLAVFLRHSGCTFCREAMADIAHCRKQIEDQGAAIALIHMGQSDPLELLEKNGLTDVHRFGDPCCLLYDAFGLGLGSVTQLLGPSVWLRGAKAFFSGHLVGRLDGNGFRMPGVFLIHKGEIVQSFHHATAADRPDYVELATLPGSTTSSVPTGTHQLLRR